jgi:hypothetical protein
MRDDIDLGSVRADREHADELFDSRSTAPIPFEQRIWSDKLIPSKRLEAKHSKIAIAAHPNFLQVHLDKADRFVLRQCVGRNDSCIGLAAEVLLDAHTKRVDAFWDSVLESIDQELNVSEREWLLGLTTTPAMLLVRTTGFFCVVMGKSSQKKEHP